MKIKKLLNPRNKSPLHNENFIFLGTILPNRLKDDKSKIHSQVCMHSVIVEASYK